MKYLLPLLLIGCSTINTPIKEKNCVLRAEGVVSGFDSVYKILDCKVPISCADGEIPCVKECSKLKKANGTFTCVEKIFTHGNLTEGEK